MDIEPGFYLLDSRTNYQTREWDMVEVVNNNGKLEFYWPGIETCDDLSFFSSGRFWFYRVQPPGQLGESNNPDLEIERGKLVIKEGKAKEET